MSPEAKLIRELAEDLAFEVLASYKPEDFEAAEFTSLGQAYVYLREHNEGPGPALEELIKKVQRFAGSQATDASGPEDSSEEGQTSRED